MKRPSGIPHAESTARRRVSEPGEEPAEDAPMGEVRSLRPPKKKKKKKTRKKKKKGHEPSAAGGTEAPLPAEDGASADPTGDDDAERADAEDADAQDAALADAQVAERADARDAERIDAQEPDAQEPEAKRPPGLKNMTTSARLRLELALEHDDDDDEVVKRPPGLKHMTTSARQRLELALEHDEDVSIEPPRLGEGRLSQPELGAIPFDEEGRRIIRSLMRWVAFCGLITMTLGALTGLSYVTGPGSIAHVVVGILASAVSIWLLAASWSFRRVLTERQQAHHLIHALGHLRSALLLKAVLVFAAMVLGCFTFSIAGSLLFLLG